MSRSKLKRLYNLAIAAALLVGFGVGYALRGPGVTPGAERLVAERVTDRHFPGCRARYLEIKRAFAYGPYVRADYSDVLQQLKAAIDQDPGYLPYHFLLAAVYEDWAVNAEHGRLTEQDLALVSQQLGVRSGASAEELARVARRQAADVWEAAGQHALVREVATYGPQWRAIRDQHLSALQDRRDFQATRGETGALDLTEAYNLFGITRDHDRYPNNLSAAAQGYSFEEKHMGDVLFCPQHPKVGFNFPCIQYLPTEENKTIREDVEFFRTVFGIDGQKLDVEDVEAEAIHLLCFNVTPEGRAVRAVCQVAYSGGAEEAKPIVVGPWRQNDALLRDPEARRRLDAVHRDSEMHKCNGSELEMANAPVYMYHVAVPLDASARLDKIAFPRYDATTTGLEDPGIADVRIVAISLQLKG